MTFRENNVWLVAIGVMLLAFIMYAWTIKNVNAQDVPQPNYEMPDEMVIGQSYHLPTSYMCRSSHVSSLMLKAWADDDMERFAGIGHEAGEARICAPMHGLFHVINVMETASRTLDGTTYLVYLLHLRIEHLDMDFYTLTAIPVKKLGKCEAGENDLYGMCLIPARYESLSFGDGGIAFNLAYHRRGRDVMVIGRLATFNVYICDTVDQILEFFNAYNSGGVEAGDTVWHRLTSELNEVNESRCAMQVSSFIPVELILKFTTPTGQKIVIFEFMSGTVRGLERFAGLVAGVDLITAEEWEVQQLRPVDFRANCLSSRYANSMLNQYGYTLDKEIIEDERMVELAALVNAEPPITTHIPNWVVVAWNEEGHATVVLLDDVCALAMMTFIVGEEADHIRGILERNGT